MKFDQKSLANAAGISAGLVYLACVVMVWLSPQLFRVIFDSWFHGVDVSSLPIKGTPLLPTVIGLVTFSAAAWLFGWVFAYFYNQSAKK